MTEAEAKRIAEVTAGVGGVKEVYTLFQIMTPEQAQALQQSSRKPDGLPPSNPTPTGVSPSVTGTVGGTSNMMTDTMAPAAGQPSVAPIEAPSTPEARPL